MGFIQWLLSLFGLGSQGRYSKTKNEIKDLRAAQVHAAKKEVDQKKESGEIKTIEAKFKKLPSFFKQSDRSILVKVQAGAVDLYKKFSRFQTESIKTEEKELNDALREWGQLAKFMEISYTGDKRHQLMKLIEDIDKHMQKLEADIEDEIKEDKAEEKDIQETEEDIAEEEGISTAKVEGAAADIEGAADAEARTVRTEKAKTRFELAEDKSQDK